MSTIGVWVDPSKLNPGQIKLLRSQAWGALLAGGFGSGKTTGLCLKALQLRCTNGPGIPGVIVSQSYPSLKSVIIPRLRKMLVATLGPEVGREWMRVRDPSGAQYLDWGGTHVYLRSANNPSTFDGLDVGWLCGDEIRHWPKHSYEVAVARVRVPCALPQRAFASTPSIGWMADEFNTNRAGRELIVAPTKENAAHLAPGTIENLRLSYSPRLQKAVIDGMFVPLEGPVYEAVDPDVFKSAWAVDWKYSPQKKTTLAIDPGFRRSAYLFFQEVAPLEWVCFDEVLPEDESDFSAVQRVNAKGYQIDEIWCDPAADSTQSAIGLDVISALKGIKSRSRTPLRYIVNPYRSIAFGVDKVRVLLGEDKPGGLPIRLKFSRALLEIERGRNRGIVRDLVSYTYPEDKQGRALSGDPLKDGLSDHTMDALRYWGVGMWLTSSLRMVDPRLAEAKAPGYKAVA